MKNPKEKNILGRYLVALLKNTTDFKRFLSNLQEKKGKTFKSIDTIHKPTKNREITPLCCFTQDISKA